MEMPYVYEHHRPDKNVCFYVGKGSGNRAWRMHTNRNKHHQRICQKLETLGLEVDVRIVADGLTNREALDLEIALIASHDRKELANQTAGGDGLRDPTPETLEKMRDAAQRRKLDPVFKAKHLEAVREANSRPEAKRRWEATGIKRRGTKASLETRAKQSAALKGRKLSPEHIEALSGDKNPFFGKAHTEETKQVIADKKRGSKHSPETLEKMRIAQKARRDAEALLKPPPEPKPPRTPHKHTPETIEKMRVAAKIRGVSEATRIAHREALTGRKRAPFTDETRERMSQAARVTWARKKAEKESAG